MSILTIAIPTYNRAPFLDDCLKSLRSGLKNSENIELLVVNNCSKDNTDDIVAEHSKCMNIKYIKNDTNIGPDENFKKCLIEAKSKFVWIFGDDDIFLDGVLEKLVQFIQKNENMGLIHLKAKSFIDDREILNYKVEDFKYHITHKKEEVIKFAHLNITFLSANIFNKDIVIEKIEMSDIPNNNLGQLFWNIIALANSEKSAFISSSVFAARVANSGNYNLCKVFAENFMNSLEMINRKFFIKNFINIYEKRLLMVYFPANIVRIRCGLSKVSSENCFKILYKRYKGNIYFWFFTLPAIVLPKSVAYIIYKIADILRKK